MTEKEAYIYEWIKEISKSRPELGGFSICPYASSSKIKIIECAIDDIVPEPGHDVIIFIVEDFWQSHKVKNWADFYNQKYNYYKFFKDCFSENSYIGNLKTNNERYNLIICQSKKKLRKVREKLSQTEYYTHWNEDYLKEILGEDIDLVKKEEN